MSPAEIFYVGGMSTISVAFPTLLVVMWALGRARPHPLAVVAAMPQAQPAELRKAA